MKQKITSLVKAVLFSLTMNDLSIELRLFERKVRTASQFFRGQIDKYTWQDVGSSYLMSELSAAFLYAQFENADVILKNRLQTWKTYFENLKPLAELGYIDLPVIPSECVHNGHMFYIKLKDLDERTKVIEKLRKENIQCLFHYIPLHSAPAGEKYGRFYGIDEFTTREKVKYS